MGIYILNYLSLPVYRLILKKNKAFCIAFSIQLFLILALRHPSLGVDYITYSSGFEYISNLSFSDMLLRLRLVGTAKLTYPFVFESGYVVLNWIVAEIGFSFHGLLVVCAAINCASIGRFIYKYSNNPLLSFAIFVSFNMYVYCFGIIRQSLALSVVLWAVPYIIEKKRTKAILLIMIAFLFHRVAIIWLPFVFLFKIPITKKRFLAAYFTGIALILFASYIYKNVITKMMLIIEVTNRLTIDFQYNNFALLIEIIGIIIYFFIDFKLFENSNLNLACWGLIFLFLFEPVSMCNEVFARASELYTVFLIILIPGLIYTYKNSNTKLIANVVVFILMFGYMIYSLSSNNVLIPYKVFW